MSGYTGSAIVLDGTSGSGKTFLASRIAIACAESCSGFIVAYDPTGHVQAYVSGYLSSVVSELDEARKQRHPYEERLLLARKIDLLRSTANRFYGIGEEHLFATRFLAIVKARPPFPVGCVVIDEGGFARNDRNAKDILESCMRSCVPLARNAGILAVLSGHRLMAAVPEIRAVMRARVMWPNPDPTARDLLVEHAESRGWSIYSDPMASGVENPKYRGVLFGVEGRSAAPFEFGRDEALPEWIYRHAVM